MQGLDMDVSPAMMALNTHKSEWTCVSWFNKISDAVASKTYRFFGYAVATLVSVITFIPSLAVDLGYAAKRLHHRKITKPQTPVQNHMLSSGSQTPISNQVSGSGSKTPAPRQSPASSIQSLNVTNAPPSSTDQCTFVDTPMPIVSPDVAKTFTVALKESGIDESTNIYSAASLDDVLLRGQEQRLVLLGSGVATQYGLDSVGSIVVRNSSSKGLFFQTVSSGPNGVLVLVSDIEDILSSRADLIIPIDHECNSSFMTKIGSGAEAVVYDKGNGQVLCAVDCHHLVKSDPELDINAQINETSVLREIPGVARKRLRKMLALAQFDNYVHLNGFSFSPDGCTLYITTEKLEEVNLHQFGEEYYRSLLRDFFLELKAMKLKGVIHGDISPKNIMARNNDGKAQLVLIDVGHEQTFYGTKGYSFGRSGSDQDIQSAALVLCDQINAERFKAYFVRALGGFRDRLYQMYRRDVGGSEFSLRNLKGLVKFIVEDFGPTGYDDKQFLINEVARFLSCENNIFDSGVFNKYDIRRLANLGAIADIMSAMPALMAEFDTVSGSTLISQNADYFRGWFSDYAVAGWEKTAITSSEDLLCLKALIAYEKYREQFSNNNWCITDKARSEMSELSAQLVGVEQNTVSIDQLIRLLEQGR